MTSEMIRDSIGDFQQATKGYFGTHAFSTGYLGSLVATLLEDLPSDEQEKHIKYLKQSTIDYLKLNLEKTL